MERGPADIRALGSRNWPSPPWGGFQGTQDPRNLDYDPLMVLLSSGLMGPSPASGRGLLTGDGEFLFNHQYIQGKSFPIPDLLVFLKQEWQVSRAGRASGSYSAAIASVADDQGGTQ